jgi:hypothetical protein
MTRSVIKSCIATAFSVASLATLLYTIGAPGVSGG